MLKLGQRGVQRGQYVLVIAAGAEVQQQLAHIGQTLPDARIELSQGVPQALGLACGHAGNLIAQQAALDFEESQTLGDGIMQLAGDQAPLFRDGRLAAQRIEAKTMMEQAR